MTTRMRVLMLASAALFALGFAASAQAQSTTMTFFVTSVGSGKGGDLGGLAGADAHCQTLAAAAGAGSKTWHAYLSTQGAAAVNARDRIGSGPWTNVKGTVVARGVDDLHGASNNLTKQTSLTEKGGTVNGVGDTPNMHDVLTGSTPEGRAIAGDADMTCKNYASSTAGAVMLGHSDRTGLNDNPPSKSWNASHASRGCSQDDLKGTGGAGLYYCFATN
jgi:hypothetical protein